MVNQLIGTSDRHGVSLAQHDESHKIDAMRLVLNQETRRGSISDSTVVHGSGCLYAVIQTKSCTTPE